MKFYYFKNGKGNVLAKKLLDDYKKHGYQNPVQAIFFEKCTISDLKAERNDIDTQAIDFYKWTQNELGDDVYSVIVSDGKYWITKPTGFINDKELGKEFRNRTGYHIKNENNEYGVKDDDPVKIAEVKIVSSGPLKDVPTILSNIGANQYLIRGTFREIKKENIGNLLALDKIIRNEGITNYKRKYEKTFLTALRCLGANEVETLIAKIFEESGLFVSSYVGGFMKDIDLFVYNDNKNSVKVGIINFEGNSRKTVQIKSYLGLINTKVPEPIDIYFQLDGEYRSLNSRQFLLNHEWIKQVLPKLDNTGSWLKRLLNWIPKDLIELL